MNYQKINNKIIIRIDKGEEIVQTLSNLCKKLNIKAATVQGIGATNNATIGSYDTTIKQYHSTEFIGEFEITNLTGNITTMNNETYLHLHITIADEKHHAYGGHLNRAIISATFEAVIDLISEPIQRQYDSSIGLNLIKIE